MEKNNASLGITWGSGGNIMEALNNLEKCKRGFCMENPERPQDTHGPTRRGVTGCGKLYLTYSEADGYKETFIWLGKTGGCASAFLEAIGRLMTFALNAGVPESVVIKAFKGIRCPSQQMDNLSCPDVVAKLLEGIMSNEIKSE